MSKGIQTVKPSSLLQGESLHIQGITSSIDDLKILGSPFRAAVSDAILSPGIGVTRSIDEATFLTIPLADPTGELRQSPLLQSAFTLELDGLHFRHAGLDRNEDGSITLRPRSREVAKLMAAIPEDGKADKVFRGKWTRAEFVYKLVKQVRPEIPFYCPALHDRQPIKSERQAKQDNVDRNVRRDRGLDEGAHLTVKGVAATSEQINLADLSLRTAESLGASADVMTGLICAEINETTIKNVNYGDRSSLGVLQLLDIHGTAAERLDPVFCVTKFCKDPGFTGAGGAISLDERGMAVSDWLGLVMQDAGGTPYVGLQYLDEARTWVAAFGGGSLKSGSTTTEVTRRYSFEQKPSESVWACMKRLGDEVNWRRFEAAGVVYFIAETDLLDSKVRMRVSEDAPGIDAISWRYDSPRKVQELSVTCRAKAWSAPPGSVAEVEGEGQADGSYIVAQIESVLSDESATITLRRPTKPLPEPSPETTTKTVGGIKGGVPPNDTQDPGGLSVVTSLGDPHWGGSADVMLAIVDPVMATFGIQPGARKEPGHAVGGDHDLSVTNAFATDYPTTDGATAAKAVAEALGTPNWSPGSYATYEFTAGGVGFRHQILWAVPDHYDHVHVGIRRT